MNEEILVRMKTVVKAFEEFVQTLDDSECHQCGRFVVSKGTVRMLASSGKGLLNPKDWDFKDFQCAMEALPRLYFELTTTENKFVVALRMAEVWKECLQVETVIRR